MQKYVLLLAFLWLFVACGPTSKSNESPKPEFSLEPVETKLELSAGGESTTIINLKRNTGFEDNVIMRFEGLPEGVEQVWSRDTENGDCTVTLSAPSELAEGSFQIRLTGTSEASNNLRLAAGDFSQPLSLVITPFNPFTISMQPAIFAMPVDSVTSAFLSVKKRAGFTEAVRISFVNLPSGVSFLCHAQECPAQAQDSYTVEFEDQILFSLSYAADAPIANHSASIEVSKLDGSAKKTIPLQLNVQAAAINPTFKLLAASLSVTAPFDTDVAVRLSIVRTKGFDKQIVLKSITEGFRANDVVTGQNSTLSFINVRRLKDSSLFLPANQIFTIQGQAVGANITKNLNMTFNIIPVSGDRDLTLSSSVITSSGAADHGLVVLPDGRYVVGSTETSSFVLRRFNADGSPDPGFVSRFQTAKVIISFGDPAELRAIALAPDGDLVAVGIVRVGSSQARNVAVVKVNPDGSLDESFGGKRVIPFSLGEARAVVVTSSGQILIAGQTASTLPESSVFLPQAEVATSCLIFALRPNGSFDSSFSSDGITTLAVDRSGFRSSNDACNAIALGPNNVIVLGGISEDGNDSRFFVARLQANGSPDQNFGGSGMVVTDVRDLTDVVNNVLVQPNGKIIAAGFGVDNDTEFGILARYNSSGSLDTSFDGDGIRATQTHTISSGLKPFERGIRGLALKADGSILMIEHTTSNQPILRQLQSDGSTFTLNRQDLVNTKLSDLKLDANGNLALVGDRLERRFP